MSPPIIKNIALVLLLALAGSVATLGGFYLYLRNTSHTIAFADIAGRQRMLAQQLVNNAHMALAGHEGDDVLLRESVAQFSTALHVMRQGGKILSYDLPPSPPELGQSLDALDSRWKPLQETALALAGGSGGQAAYDFIQTHTTELTAAANSVLLAHRTRTDALRERVLVMLGAVTLLDLGLLWLGVSVVRRYAEDRRQIEETLHRDKQELEALNTRLTEAHQQLMQSEKMASIGQLAAGVAHEINNPVGYINSNISSLREYVGDLLALIDNYEKVESRLPEENTAELRRLKEQLQLEYLRQDITQLLDESQDGVNRVRQIVKDLKEFSHIDEQQWQYADLHQGLDSTLNIVRNEIKYKAEVIKEYGSLPQVRCIATQINQVFMNLLVNAAQAIEERGTITLRTGTAGDDWIWVEIRDTGKGIAREHLNRIFDPFFTTKPVGKGTGLGLSLSYTIVEKHGGRIEVESEVGKGTAFKIWLPVQAGETTAAAA